MRIFGKKRKRIKIKENMVGTKVPGRSDVDKQTKQKCWPYVTRKKKRNGLYHNRVSSDIDMFHYKHNIPAKKYCFPSFYKSHTPTFSKHLFRKSDSGKHPK